MFVPPTSTCAAESSCLSPCRRQLSRSDRVQWWSAFTLKRDRRRSLSSSSKPMGPQYSMSGEPEDRVPNDVASAARRAMSVVGSALRRSRGRRHEASKCKHTRKKSRPGLYQHAQIRSCLEKACVVVVADILGAIAVNVATPEIPAS
jgi:hypothetical protein